MKYVSIISEVVVAIAIGAVTSFWTSGNISFIIGAISFFSIELIRLRLTTEKVLELHNFINSSINILKPRDKVSELALLYGLRNFSKFKQESIWVPKEYTWDFWKDCIGRVENKFSIISYTALDETWNLKGWREFAIAVQEERIKNGCKFNRVFCIDSESEKEMVRDEMLTQQKIGIDVGYVLKRDLLSNKLLNEYQQDIKTLDVAVIDDSWVMRGHLDKDRNFIGASATRDNEILKKASFLVREAQKIAKRDLEFNRTSV